MSRSHATLPKLKYLFLENFLGIHPSTRMEPFPSIHFKYRDELDVSRNLVIVKSCPSSILAGNMAIVHPSLAIGIYVGTTVANAVLVDRAKDGNVPYRPYPGSSNPGMWRPTPPSFAEPEVPQWANMKPWCMTSDSEFRPAPPPAVDTPYATDNNQISRMRAKLNSTRTSEQSDIAAFGFDGPATDTPPGTSDTVSDQLSIQKGFDD